MTNGDSSGELQSKVSPKPLTSMELLRERARMVQTGGFNSKRWDLLLFCG